MDRRAFLGRVGCVALGTLAAGCRGAQHAHVLKSDDKDMVGSHTAGAETWEPLIQDSVAKILGRQHVIEQTAGVEGATVGRKRICFVGIENKSAEDIGDFKEQIYQKIDTCINGSPEFEVINKRAVEAGLRTCHLRPDDLFVPNHRRAFAAAMEQNEQSFDYLMFATITSGTTKSNQKDYQRDYLFTIELVHMESGHTDKESAEIRKGYHKTRIGKLRHYGS